MVFVSDQRKYGCIDCGLRFRARDRRRIPREEDARYSPWSAVYEQAITGLWRLHSMNLRNNAGSANKGSANGGDAEPSRPAVPEGTRSRLYQARYRDGRSHPFAWGLDVWALDVCRTRISGRYLSCSLVAVAASGMKVQLPGVEGTVSLNFLFVLIGIAEFNLGEALMMGCLGVCVQCVFQAKARLKPVQVAFSVASVACSIQVAYAAHHAPKIQGYVLTAATYFLANTAFIAGVIALGERKNPWVVWRDSYLWSYPNYLVGAAGAWIIGLAHHSPAGSPRYCCCRSSISFTGRTICTSGGWKRREKGPSSSASMPRK